MLFYFQDQPAPYYGVVACEFRGENFVYGERLEIWSAAVNYDHLEEVNHLYCLQGAAKNITQSTVM